MTVERRPLKDRLAEWSMPEPNSGCLLWLGRVNRTGYGVMSVTHSKRMDAHRVAYMVEHGPIPVGLQLDHLCRVRSCVNPAHLEPVPPKVNYLRGQSFAAKKARQTHCIHGHPLSGENLRLTKKGHRMCLTCSRTRARALRRAA